MNKFIAWFIIIIIILFLFINILIFGAFNIRLTRMLLIEKSITNCKKIYFKTTSGDTKCINLDDCELKKFGFWNGHFIYKTCDDNYLKFFGKNLDNIDKYEIEKEAYLRLQKYDCFPKLFGYNDKMKCLWIENAGTPLPLNYIQRNKILPKDFVEQVKKCDANAKKENIVLYDREWKNCLVKDGKVKFIDFEFVHFTDNPQLKLYSSKPKTNFWLTFLPKNDINSLIEDYKNPKLLNVFRSIDIA